MKVFFFISLIALILGMSGCVTNRPILFPSSPGSSGLGLPGPTLAQLEPGVSGWGSLALGTIPNFYLGPYVLDYMKGDYLLSTAAGLVWQPDLRPSLTAGPFLGLGGAFSYGSLAFTSYPSLPTQLWGPFSTMDTELLAKPGLFLRFPVGILQVFGLGGVKWEEGRYRAFRTFIDGRDNRYNLSVDPWSWKAGFGGDLQFGRPNRWSLGWSASVTFDYSRSQSFIDAELRETVDPYYDTYVIETSPDGNLIQRVRFTLSPYLDFPRFRVSAHFSLLEAYQVSVLVRWQPGAQR